MKIIRLSAGVAAVLLATQAWAADINARTLTGASTPPQSAPYGVRNYSAPLAD